MKSWRWWRQAFAAAVVGCTSGFVLTTISTSFAQAFWPGLTAGILSSIVTGIIVGKIVAEYGQELTQRGSLAERQRGQRERVETVLSALFWIRPEQWKATSPVTWPERVEDTFPPIAKRLVRDVLPHARAPFYWPDLPEEKPLAAQLEGFRKYYDEMAQAADDLQRVAVHAERGEQTIEQMVRLCAGHDLLHLNQVERILMAIEYP